MFCYFVQSLPESDMLMKQSLFGSAGRVFFLFFGVLVIPALYINLGLIPLKGDEAIRAVVALEMMLSDNYITPTLAGEIYLNKPPLYNWVLIGFFKLFGSSSEFVVRFPTTIFLALYCITIFYWVSKELGKQMGLLVSLAFLTCGRILFWDSFLGLIDIAFSWITFLNFMLIWHYYNKSRFISLFIVSYLLTAVAFLLKGIPSIAFQGITLLVIFIQGRNFKTLFTWKHLVGIMMFFGLTGIYYLIYYFKNPDYLDNALLRLVIESTDKSAIGNGIQKTLLHMVAFPLELLQHFLPWIILVVFLFHKKIFRKILKQDFIRFCFVVLIANIAVYWLSPTTYPRYLLMLMPLAFVTFIFAGKFHAFNNTLHYRFIKNSLIIFMAGISLTSIGLPLIYSSRLPVNQFNLKITGVILLNAGFLYYMAKHSGQTGLLYSVIIVLLIARISFNLFLQPYRQSTDLHSLCRKDAIELAHGTKGQPLYYMTDTITIPNVYYLTRERNQMLTFNDNPSAGPFFIVDDTLKNNFRRMFSMHVPYNFQTFYAGKFIKQ